MYNKTLWKEFVTDPENQVGVIAVPVYQNNNVEGGYIRYTCSKCKTVIRSECKDHDAIVPTKSECPICSNKREFVRLNIVTN